MSDLLYLDTSSFVRIVLGEHDGESIKTAVETHQRQGGRLVSSRLLWLEARRTAVNRRVDPTAWSSRAKPILDGIDQVDLTDEIWDKAHANPFRLRTLDALHLATCQEIKATLLSSDNDMVTAARGLAIATC